MVVYMCTQRNLLQKEIIGDDILSNLEGTRTNKK